MYCYCTYDLMRRDHERTVGRAEHQTRLHGYPAPKRRRFFSTRQEGTGSWAPCAATEDLVPRPNACWSRSA